MRLQLAEHARPLPRSPAQNPRYRQLGVIVEDRVRHLAEEAERWLGKPVIAINAATWWMAMRDNGIEEKVYGAGRLLREF